MSKSHNQHAARQNRKRFSLRTYIAHHRHALLHGFRQLTKNPFASLLTIAVLSITLVLPTGLLVILGNAQQYTQVWQTGTNVSVYMQPQATNTQVSFTRQALQKVNNIKTINYVSPNEGLANFAKQSGLNDIIKTLGANPLPGLFSIKPNDQSPAAINILVSQLQALPNVDAVKLDMQWVKRLNAIITLLEHFTYGLVVLLGLSVLLIIGNTIRMAVQSYHHEIEVIKLVGGSNHFTRRPFLYSGAFYGLASGIFAAVILDFFLLWLQNPLNKLTALYGTHVNLEGLDFSQTCLLLLCGLALGYLGSWLVVDRHLKRINPE